MSGTLYEKCLNKVKEILYEVLGNKLLDNTYTYSFEICYG